MTSFPILDASLLVPGDGIEWAENVPNTGMNGRRDTILRRLDTDNGWWFINAVSIAYDYELDRWAVLVGGPSFVRLCANQPDDENERLRELIRSYDRAFNALHPDVFMEPEGAHITNAQIELWREVVGTPEAEVDQ